MFILNFVRWVFRTVLIILGVLPLTRCSSGYRQKDGKITFNGKEITDKSFVVLSNEFAKDSSTAYYKQQPFEYADVASFEAVDAHYAKDKSRAYYCDEYREGQNYYMTKKQTIVTIDLAIPATFVSADNGYAKDSKHAYFMGKPFKVKDINTFKSINANFSRDDVNAYLNCKPIAGSDGKTFEILDEFYARDAAHIYYCEFSSSRQLRAQVLPCNRDKFTLLAYPFSKDDVAVFYNSKKIGSADAASFEVLGNGYSRDKISVYFEAQKMLNTDVATFELYADNERNPEDFRHAKDKYSVFIDGQKIAGADVATFRILSLGYALDRNHVFYKTAVVKNANVATFKTYPHGFGDEDAEDANNKYLAGKIVVALEE